MMGLGSRGWVEGPDKGVLIPSSSVCAGRHLPRSCYRHIASDCAAVVELRKRLRTCT
jgi:hypothetical protein